MRGLSLLAQPPRAPLPGLLRPRRCGCRGRPAEAVPPSHGLRALPAARREKWHSPSARPFGPSVPECQAHPAPTPNLSYYVRSPGLARPEPRRDRHLKSKMVPPRLSSHFRGGLSACCITSRKLDTGAGQSRAYISWPHVQTSTKHWGNRGLKFSRALYEELWGGWENGVLPSKNLEPQSRSRTDSVSCQLPTQARGQHCECTCSVTGLGLPSTKSRCASSQQKSTSSGKLQKHLLPQGWGYEFPGEEETMQDQGQRILEGGEGALLLCTSCVTWISSLPPLSLIFLICKVAYMIFHRLRCGFTATILLYPAHSTWSINVH